MRISSLLLQVTEAEVGCMASTSAVNMRGFGAVCNEDEQGNSSEDSDGVMSAAVAVAIKTEACIPCRLL